MRLNQNRADVGQDLTLVNQQNIHLKQEETRHEQQRPLRNRWTLWSWQESQLEHSRHLHFT